MCVLSVHTLPLEQPGTGDAGGMNVYIVETARRMARLGVEVEVFTRATSSEHPPVAELAPGVLVRHVAAGPFEGLPKEFTAGRYHSLFAMRDTLPSPLEVTAESEDGVVMAIEHASLPVAAVQFHPESIMSVDDDLGLRLLRNVVERLIAPR